MRDIFHTPQAPAAIGPYSQAVGKGAMVFTSGQIALDAGTGELINEDIKVETSKALDNLKAVLHAAGCTLDDVYSTTVYVRDMTDYEDINEIYAQYFDEKKAPARALVEVSRLPRDARIEISAIAFRSSANTRL